LTLEEFKKKTSFTCGDVIDLAVEGGPIPSLPGSLLLPFHEITQLSWDEKSQTGHIETVRYNRIDEWFYACHFQGDPVMPGCWGIDAIWQSLRLFAAWRGLTACDKTLGMENVSFFGQIRPYDKKITYSVDILSIEEADGEHLVTGKATVSVDGTTVYTIANAQIGTAYWEADPAAKPPTVKPVPEEPMTRRLHAADFSAKNRLSRAEVLALSQGTLLDDFTGEVGLLPSSLMLEIGRIHQLSFDAATGEGRIVAAKPNSPVEWYYPMNHNLKPTALTIDAVWQLLGLFLFWRQNAGTGRALGFEKVEVFDAIKPGDKEVLFDVQVLRTTRTEATGDAFVRADAKVFADGRLVLSCGNANVGCHKHIRYSDYPQMVDMGFGGKLKTRKD
jgi:3-hydroxyacyl-[acyl-carrier protein] dehydratase/trans-2-decenoyl-[acyl-carrier protein] isomerase